MFLYISLEGYIVSIGDDDRSRDIVIPTQQPENSVVIGVEIEVRVIDVLSKSETWLMRAGGVGSSRWPHIVLTSTTQCVQGADEQ